MRIGLIGVMLVAVAGCGDAKREATTGQEVYAAYCQSCHLDQGQGIERAFPPLRQTEWVLGDDGRLVRLMLGGMQGPLEINGVRYNNAMPPHDFLTDEQIAAVLSFVRTNFGNDADSVTVETVRAIRASYDRDAMWTPEALWEATGR